MTEKINRLDVSPVTSEVQRLTRALEADPQNAQLHIKRGMASFQLVDIAASIDDFDQAERLDTAWTHISGSAALHITMPSALRTVLNSLETDLTVNGHDVEETVWLLLCQAQAQGADAARLALLPVRDDSPPDDELGIPTVCRNLASPRS